MIRIIPCDGRGASLILARPTIERETMTPDPYFDTIVMKKRLLAQYNLHGSLIIGFDFDDTIYDCRDEGSIYPKVITILQKCSELGFIMCLYTCREGICLEECIPYCAQKNIRVDFINESPAMKGTRKPYFNILLDDKAGLFCAYLALKWTIEEIERNKK